MKRIQLRVSAGIAIALLMGTVSCDNAFVGIGNSGNRISEDAGLGDAIAQALATNEGVPDISDETLAEIFGAVLTQARSGDPRAALIVLRMAEVQREDDT